MRRIASTPRPNWQQRVEEAGLSWHSSEQPYWNESAFYQFTAKEVSELETATNELAGCGKTSETRYRQNVLIV
jgi:glutathionylspermidine synthase